jgi:hypothetical protein
MSSIISDASEYIKPAHDPFMDGHPTRRELQKAFNKLGNNDSDLMAMVDTNCLVVNFLCEKLGVTRGELDAYVSRKAEEVKTMQEAQKPVEPTNEQSNV